MNRIALVCWGVVLTVLIVSRSLLAHHGSTAYDSTKTDTLKGTVIEYKMINPHSEISLAVEAADGNKMTWEVLLPSANTIRRAGWNKNTVKPGDRITVIGHPGKGGAKIMQLRRLILADGTEVPRLPDKS